MPRVYVSDKFVVAAANILDKAWPMLITRIEPSSFGLRIGRNWAFNRP